ncbi:mutS protein homolog 4-like [Amphibalanus amphitrite]|uniref:mutS protein homolog 4-like n=1 Tax=Amphibalanus amphitrite TaxID=1232801 RepID=UPI001C901382|nr:mutS protein homolog 4-like [Amphibalanus amphitrite]XP_043228334.1 mutS protein homolog 4-like [Amphibalanus amphitrite]XP_043228335.1 mutS protein homolog 4-like [Amphibalanus amphitrite]
MQRNFFSLPQSVSGSSFSGHGSARSRVGAGQSGGLRARTAPRSGGSGPSGAQRTPRLDQLGLSSISAGSGSLGRTAHRSSSGSSTPWSRRSHTPGSERRRAHTTPGSVTPRPVQSSTVLALAAGRGQATGAVGLAALDPDCPLLVLSQLSDSYTYSRVIAKIQVINPCQILLPNTLCDPSQPLYRLLCEQFGDVTLTSLPRHHFQSEAGQERVAGLCLPSLASVTSALRNMYYCATAAAALLVYMESVKSVVFRQHTLKVEFQTAEATVMINSETCRRLELVQPQPGGRPEQTVFAVIKRTQTPGGSRRLRAELLQPSVSLSSIRTRQECVQELVDSPDLLYLLRAVIGRFQDIEKIHSFCIQQHDWDTERNVEHRLNHIISLKASLECVEALREALAPAQHPFLVSMRECLQEPVVESLLLRLRAVVHDDVQPCRGGIEQRVQRCYAIKSGINGMLDVARRLYSEAYDEFVCYVQQLGEQHRLALKPGYNTSRGFHAILALGRRGSRPPALPEEFIQVQHNQSTLTCTTEVMVQMSQRADASVLEIGQLSNIVVCELLNELQSDLCFLYQLAEIVSTTDLLVSLADLAAAQDLKRPEFGGRLTIRGGWHPLLAATTTVPLQPSDLDVEPECRLAVITGGNMSGKSTLLKLVAVTQILAQLGSFVPADSATLPIVDQIFCRSGCEDRTEKQASSFMAEMWEVSGVLQQATARSLVLLDEPGRSTAAEEGAALTWAVCEHLLRRRCRTLAATHHQQCSGIADMYQNMAANFHLGACDGDPVDTGDQRAAAGAAHRVFAGRLRRTGYGLELAATTSLPPALLEHAKQLLETVLRPPRPLRVSDRRQQERQVCALAAKLAQLADGASRPTDELRQELRQLRQQFVASQLEGAREEGEDGMEGRGEVGEQREGEMVC